jgi:hypothetical protein
MLGRKDYTKSELDHAKAAVAEELRTYSALDRAVRATKDAKAVAALEAFEPVLFNSLVLALDRSFVHRVRPVAGKDSNPLNEVELVSESLLASDGAFRPGTVIKYKRDQSVLGLEDGDRIELTPATFEALAAAFFGDLEAKFVVS